MKEARKEGREGGWEAGKGERDGGMEAREAREGRNAMTRITHLWKKNVRPSRAFLCTQPASLSFRRMARASANVRVDGGSSAPLLLLPLLPARRCEINHAE